MSTTKDLFTELRRRFEPFISRALAHAVTRPAGQEPAVPGADADGPNASLPGADPMASCARTMDRLADREMAMAPLQGLSSREMSAARLAAFTFADEILLARPGSTWFAHGLQLNRLRTTDGGSRFYDVLGELLHAAEHEVLSRNGEQGASVPDMKLFAEDLAPEKGAHFRSCEHLARDMGNLARDFDPTDCNPPLAAAAFMALCLVYGFRGELYQAERQAELAELIQASRLLLARLSEGDERRAAATLPAGAGITRKPGLVKRLKRPNALVLVLVPVLLTALWYVLCASLVNTTTFPWSGV